MEIVIAETRQIIAGSTCWLYFPNYHGFSHHVILLCFHLTTSHHLHFYLLLHI